MTASSRPFEKLIAPVTSRTFFAEHFEKRPLILQNRPRNAHTHILSISDIAAHLDRQALPDGIDVMQSGREIPMENWTRSHPSLLGDRLLDLDRLFAQVTAGHSIRLRGLHRTIPKLRAYCAQLENDLQIPLQANLYISPQGQQALAPHYDTHDVFVLQLNGTKTWAFHQPPIHLPTQQQSFTSMDNMEPTEGETANLKPGDLAYIPRGLLHSAETSDGVSVHLSLGLINSTLVDVAQTMVEKLCADPEMRRSVPHGYSSIDAKASMLESLSNAIADQLAPENLSNSLNDVAAADHARCLEIPVTDLRLVLSGLVPPGKSDD